MTKDLALLVGADQRWLSTTGLPRQGRGKPAVPQVVPAAPPVDAWLAPGPLIALTSGAGRDALTVAENPAGQTVRTWPRPTYWSVNRARLSVADDANAPTVFTFERRGPFEWKLVHIGLPPEGSVAP
jgi:hypothetical protein